MNLFKMKSLIAVTGPNRIGKDTLYRRRSQLDQYYTDIPSGLPTDLQDHTRLAFADHLKEMLGVPPDQVTESGIPREILIDTAERIKIIRGEDYFVRYLIDEIESRRLQKVIITDLRFEVEYDELKKRFPHLIVIALESNPHGFQTIGTLKRIDVM